MDQKGSHFYGSLQPVTGRYDSKMNPGGPLDIKEVAEIVWLYVFNIEF